MFLGACKSKIKYKSLETTTVNYRRDVRKLNKQ
jgi:hypothetical protein